VYTIWAVIAVYIVLFTPWPAPKPKTRRQPTANHEITPSKQKLAAVSPQSKFYFDKYSIQVEPHYLFEFDLRLLPRSPNLLLESGITKKTKIMSVAAPPRPVTEAKASIFSRKNFLGFINVADARHVLKLRHDWKTSDALRLQLGLDFDIKTNTTRPWAGARLLLDGTKEDSWAVEVNTDWGVVYTPKFDIIPFTDKISIPIDLCLGKDFYKDGAPHVGIGMHNGKVGLLLLAATLLAKQPIRVERKEAGGIYMKMPIQFRDGAKVAHTLQTKAEIDCTLNLQEQAKLKFHDINAILRLRQD
jgi:hypothetical protein